MKVITGYPLFINGKRVNKSSDYSSVDGTSSESEILAFQAFANEKGTKLIQSGKWDPETMRAWSKLREDYEKHLKKTGRADKARDAFRKAEDSGLLSGLWNTAKDKMGLNQQSSSQSAQTQFQTDYQPESKPKGMSKGAKIGIAIGVLALVGVGIYFYTKKKK